MSDREPESILRKKITERPSMPSPNVKAGSPSQICTSKSRITKNCDKIDEDYQDETTNNKTTESKKS